LAAAYWACTTGLRSVNLYTRTYSAPSEKAHVYLASFCRAGFREDRAEPAPRSAVSVMQRPDGAGPRSGSVHAVPVHHLRRVCGRIFRGLRPNGLMELSLALLAD